MLQPREGIDYSNLNRAYESFKKYKNIELIYWDTGIREEIAIKKLTRHHYDDEEVREALRRYYDRNSLNGERLLLISDTHLCEENESSFKMLEKTYRFAERQGCCAVLHLGDLIEGDLSPRHSKQEIPEQVDLLMKRYPESKLKTYYIQGNHDIPNPNSETLPHIFRSELDAKKDLIWVGSINSYIKFNGQYFLMHHDDSYCLDIPEDYYYPVHLKGHSHKKDFDNDKMFTVPPLCLRTTDGKGPRFTFLTEYRDKYMLETFSIDPNGNNIRIEPEKDVVKIMKR